MKKLTLALLASAALAMPVAVPAMAQNSPQTQKPQAQQQQPQNPAEMKQKQSMQQPNEQQSTQQPNGQQQPNKQASSQPISPQQLGRNGVRQVQQALNKDGFHAGKTDGIWGPDTRTAVNDFQKSKDIPGNGKLNKQTLSDLGVKMAANENTGNQDNSDMNSPTNQSSTPNQK